MERKQIYEFAIIVFTIALVGIVATVPLVKQEYDTNSFIVDGKAEVQPPVILNDDYYGDFGEPCTWNGSAVYVGEHNLTDFEMMYWYNGDSRNITFNPDIYEYDPALYGDLVAWVQEDGGYNDIYIKNLTTNWTSQLTFTDEQEYNVALWGDNVIYNRYNETYSDWDIVWLNMNNMTETIIAGEPVDELYPDIYENLVVFTVVDGDNSIFMVDLDDPATFIDPIQITDDCLLDSASIWGDYVVYAGYRGGYMLPLLYHLDNQVEYELMPRSEIKSGFHPLVWDNLVVFHVVQGSDINFAVMTLKTGLFDEKYIQITNDTQEKWLWDFHDNFIVYDGEDTDTGLYNAYGIQIINVSTSEIGKEIVEQPQIVYNYDWIYMTIMVGVGLIALLITYYSEYVMEY